MKKMISFAIAVSLTIVMATQAFAASGVMLNETPNKNVDVNDSTVSAEVTAPNNKGASGYAPGGNTQVDGESYGEATITSPDSGTTWETVNDDDEINGTADTDQAQINVWAAITGANDAIYKIDIAWGAMKFAFDKGGGDWNPITHEYIASAGTAGWDVQYVDATNNKIDVTNHSNSGMTIAFDYAMSENGADSPFNDGWKSEANAVVGGFYADNADAKAAAGVLLDVNSSGALNTATITSYLKNEIWNGTDYDADIPNTIDLPTADAFNDGGHGTWTETDATNNAGTYVVSDNKANANSTGFTDDSNDKLKGGRIKSVYFAFSGTPDDDKSTTLNDFTKVGVITVTVSPNEDPTLNSPVAP